MTRPLKNLRAKALRHATGNTEYRAAFHLALHFAEPADHTLFRVIANCARVDEYDIRVLGSIYWPIAGRSKLPKHELGVADVHLAAVRLDVNGGVVRSCHADLLMGLATIVSPFSESIASNLSRRATFASLVSTER